MAREFIIFFLNYCLNHHFKSKAEMAREIGVGVSTLMRVMNSPYQFKAGSVPFQNALWYCLNHDIDIVQIFDLFSNRYKRTDGTSYVLRQERQRLCYIHFAHIILGDALLSKNAQDDLLRLLQAIYKFLCLRCYRPWLLNEETVCLPSRIMSNVIRYYHQHTRSQRPQ